MFAVHSAVGTAMEGGNGSQIFATSMVGAGVGQVMGAFGNATAGMIGGSAGLQAAVGGAIGGIGTGAFMTALTGGNYNGMSFLADMYGGMGGGLYGFSKLSQRINKAMRYEGSKTANAGVPTPGQLGIPTGECPYDIGELAMRLESIFGFMPDRDFMNKLSLFVLEAEYLVPVGELTYADLYVNKSLKTITDFQMDSKYLKGVKTSITPKSGLPYASGNLGKYWVEVIGQKGFSLYENINYNLNSILPIKHPHIIKTRSW